MPNNTNTTRVQVQPVVAPAGAPVAAASASAAAAGAEGATVIVHPNLNPPSPSAVSQKNEALRSPSAVAPSPAASAAGQQPPSVQKMLTLSSPSAASSSAPPSTAGSTRDLLDIARATTTTVLPGVSTSPGPSSPNPSSASAAEDEKKTNGTSGKATLATLQPADGDIRVRVGATASKYEVDDEDVRARRTSACAMERGMQPCTCGVWMRVER